jgi:glycosyltransferase involved in cell wall biosynthesis
MNILRIVYDWPPPWNGLAPHPYEIAVAQVKLGHKVTVFCGRWPRSGSIEQPRGVEVKSFIREPVPNTVYFTTSLLMFVHYLKWRRRNKPDVVHTHGHFAIWIYFYRLMLKKINKRANELQIPLVVHFHNTVAGRAYTLGKKEHSVKFLSRYLGWPMAKWSDRMSVVVGDALIFVSEETRNEAIKYYNADPQKCHVIETGVNTEFFRPIGPDEKDKTRRDLDIDPSEILILSHGVILERKNIHLLVDAMRFLPHKYKLFLSGPIPDKSYQNKINDIIFNNGLRGRVIMTGYVPYPNAPIAYQASDLFVLPSDWEGTPKVVIEALACGVPCLVSGFKLSEDIEGLFYLDGLTSRQIADQITELVAKQPRVDVSKIESMYSWRIRAREIDKVYEQIRKSS